MNNTPLVIDIFAGIHNDPRLDAQATVFGLGSYITAELPVSLEYLYITVTNVTHSPVTLDELFLESADEAPALSVRDLDLPSGSARGRRLRTGEKLAFGFLRDLLTRRLRYVPQIREPFVFRAVCTLRDGRRSASEPFSLPLAYPETPLQDAELSPYSTFFSRRTAVFQRETERIRAAYGSLREYADLHLSLGMHKLTDADGRTVWRWREWMPAASELWLTTDRLGFQRDERYAFRRVAAAGLWELILPAEELPHGTYVELRLRSPYTGDMDVPRIPAFATRVEQNPDILEQWCARVWDPPQSYIFRNDAKRAPSDFPRIYEAHVGIAQPSLARAAESVGTYAAFTRDILPRIAADGYTVVQLMGILEHPLYKSFGYQVSGYFAPSSRFGTPDEFRELVDVAHGLRLAVILDIPHSHAAPNTEQGIARYDGSAYFFADKGNQWGTASFDYRHDMTRRFLLSNCRYWMEAFHVDGFRFDAVGNMIYVDHGFGDDFNHVERCFRTADGSVRIDEAGVLYLALANTLVHEIAEHGMTLAEEFSGMPGMTSAPEEGGLGFDYRFAMGIPDFWGKFIKEGRTVGAMWHEMTNRRLYERTVSYVACHDQCINGKDAMIWRLIGDEMYTMMSCFTDSWKTSRGIALYKLMRLVTLSTAGHGWLNFMGDEFGHPEWIDAEAYGHRQWHLTESGHVKYAGLASFDRDLMSFVRERPTAFSATPFLRHLHEEDRTLAFERGEMLFVFNFHELQAQQGLDLWVTPGKYVERLSTDAGGYAGHGNLEIGSPPLEHFSVAGHGNGGGVQRITLYLPPLAALVLARE